MKWNGRQYRPANAQFITKKKPFDFQEALKPYGEKEMPAWSAIVGVNNETTSVPTTPTPTPSNTPTGTPGVSPTQTPTNTGSPTPTNTGTPTQTPTTTLTLTPTNTGTPTQTPTPTTTTTLPVSPTTTPTPTTTTTLTLTPTNTGSPTQTPTQTGTPTQTPTNTGTPTPTPTPNYVVRTLSATGTTGYDVCSLPCDTLYYSNSSSGPTPNVFEYIYLDAGLTQPVPDNTVISINCTGATVQIIIVNQNGAFNPGQISGIDPTFICTTQTPTPTTTQTQTPTPTITASQTPTQTGTPTQTPTNTGSPTPTPSRAPSGTTEANAYLSAVVDAGGTGITSTVSAATVTLFTSLVSNGLWESVTAFYPMLGGNSNGCKFNAKNPLDTNGAYRLTFNGGWTFNASGATSNGTNAYADTFLSSSVLPINSQHMSVYMSNNNNPVGAGKTYIGSNASRANYLAQDGTPLFYYGIGGSSAGFGPGTINTQGYLIGASSGTTDESLFKNGALIDTQGSGTRIAVNPNIYIAAMNNNGSTIQYYANQYSFATICSGLTASQASTLTTIINTFQTTLSRNTF